MMRLRVWGAVSLAALLFFIPLVTFAFSPPLQQDNSIARITEQQRRGHYQQALYSLDVLAAQQGWSPDRLRLAGDLWRESGDLTRAVPYWEAASTDLPDDLLLTRTLAEAYLALERWPAAVDQLAQLVAADPQDAWAQYHLGVLRAAFDAPAAREHLQVAANAPEYRAVANGLLRVLGNQSEELLRVMQVGLILADAEQWSFAELVFQHAADISPAYPDALAYVGLARAKQGKDGSAQIAQAVQLGPDRAVVRYVEGLHLRDANDLTGSLAALAQAAALDPQNPAYYAELGTAYQLLGDLDNAERWLRVAVTASHEDPRFQQLLAIFYAETAVEGVTDVEAIATILPDDAEVQAGLGWSFYRSGDTEAALEQLDRVLTQQPDHARSLFYKAQILLETGQLTESRTLLEQVSSLESPFQAQAQRLLEGLG